MLISLESCGNVPSSGFLQSRFWAEFKGVAGWTSERFRVRCDFDDGRSRDFPLSALIHAHRGGYTFAYVPHGPELGEPAGGPDGGELLASLARELKARLPASCAFIRFDPGWYVAEAAPQDAEGEGSGEGEATDVADNRVVERPVLAAPLRKASDVQPPDSVVLDIARGDDELLAGMKPKWRYNVKLAAKKGVVVESEGLSSIDTFYELYETTAARDRIAVHPKSYYASLFGKAAAFEPSDGEARPDVRLWVARHEGQALASIITMFHGREATYLYGASSDEKRNLMPAYALQWAAMRAAREAGCASYDFYGIPPVDDPRHAMSGLYRFKTGFGGELRHYAGAWDYVLKPGVYYGFRAAERLRLFWHKTVKKRLGRR